MFAHFDQLHNACVSSQSMDIVYAASTLWRWFCGCVNIVFCCDGGLWRSIFNWMVNETVK